MRNKTVVIIFRLLVVMHFILVSVLASAAPSTEKHVTLVFAGNMPDIGIQTYGTYSDLAGLLEKMRAEQIPTIFTFVGGSLGPSPLSSLDKGSHIIDILNTLEPDLMTLNKREFSYSEDQLTLRSYEAAFPIIGSNLYDPLTNSNLEGILTSLIVEKGNVKVGFISILDEEVVEEYLLQRAQVFEPRQIIEQQIITLKEQGAELVVLVYSKQRDYYQALIADNKIDFALNVLDESVQHVSNKVFSITGKEPFMVLHLSWQAKQPTKNLIIDSAKIDDSYSPARATTSLLVDEYNQRLNRLLNQKIGVWGSEIHTTRKLIRTMEMPIGNFIADSIKHYAKTDIALVNGGDIRGDKSYNKGAAITRRDIATELPFRKRITKLNVTGEQLREALENSVSQVEQAKGRFLQVSGLSFTYTLEKSANERIQTVHVNGQPLDLQKIYTVATSSYLANGGDGYRVFLNAQHHQQNIQKSPLMSDIVTRMIQQQATIRPEIEFRIKRVFE